MTTAQNLTWPQQFADSLRAQLTARQDTPGVDD
jgi:hypothetical protein